MRFFLFVAIFCNAWAAWGQSTDLYNDKKVSRIDIWTTQQVIDQVMNNGGTDTYYPAKFVFSDGVYSDTVLSVGLRLRGNTSLAAAKKSFKISFNAFTAGQKYQGVEKVNLNGNHNDPTMIREKLYYDIWNSFGLPERRTSFVTFYINNEYKGLYTNLEQFDEEWVQRNFAADTGNLYKCTYPAPLTYIGTNPNNYKEVENGTASGGRAYDLKTNQSADDYSGLAELIEILDLDPDMNFEQLIAQNMHMETCLKAMAVEVICGHWDNYIYNKNNYYLYDDPQNGFYFLSYDVDNSFGVDWVGVDWTTQDVYNWTESTNRPLYTKLMARPNFRGMFTKYLDSLAQFYVNPTIIFPHIDSLEALIEPAAAADNYRTLDYGYSLNDFHEGFYTTVDGHTPYGIKPFLEKRIQYLSLQVPSADIIEDLWIFAAPNPTTHSIVLKGTEILGSSFDIEVYDVDGRLYRKIEGHHGKNINVTDWYPGIYILSLKSETKIAHIRLVRE
jgi:spore coat protein CotH